MCVCVRVSKVFEYGRMHSHLIMHSVVNSRSLGRRTCAHTACECMPAK